MASAAEAQHNQLLTPCAATQGYFFVAYSLARATANTAMDAHSAGPRGF